MKATMTDLHPAKEITMASSTDRGPKQTNIS